MSTITPTEGNVVVEVKGQAEKTKGGLYVPEEARGTEFIAIAVPAGCTRCKEGDRVLINQKNAVLLTVDERRVMVLPANDVLAVVS